MHGHLIKPHVDKQSIFLIDTTTTFNSRLFLNNSYQLPRRVPTSPYLQKLHWLRVEARIEYKILLLVYKAKHQIAPKYLCDMIGETPSTRYHLRSATAGKLYVPRSNCKRFGDRSFGVCGPKLWNLLPSHLVNCRNIVDFKKKLKTNLFGKYCK